MNQEAGMIRLLEENKGRLILMAHKGLSEELRTAEENANEGDSISAKVALAKEPIFLYDTQDTGGIKSPLIEFGFQSVACVPIQSKGKLIGTLSVASRDRRSFPPSVRQLLISVGNQVGTAVENATLYIRERQMVEGLKEMDRLKAEFLSNLSHELRTPLTSIIGFSELLLDKIPGPLNNDQEEYVKNMQGSGQHLLELINNLLDLSKIKAGKMEMHTKEFYIRNLIQVVTSTIAPLVNKKGLHLETSIEEDISHIYADEGKLKQCLLNLLSNAVKFTPAGGQIQIDVRSSSLADQPALMISIKDTGIGIKKEDTHKIFEEFRQAEGSYTREYQGTGLGLPITRRFVEMHGGKIWVESETGKGSKFVMLIPTRIAYVPTETREEKAEAVAETVVEIPQFRPELEQEISALALEMEPAMAKREMEQLRILVVEDDPKTSQLLNLYLTEAGYQVEQAYDGETALEMAKALKPFAITLDIMLPKMDGWEVLQKLKSIPETRDIPVIIVSIIENQELGLSLGAAGYFTKPIDHRSLLDSLRKQQDASRVRKKPLSVLMIDDDPEIIQLIEAFLEAEGISLIKARNGETGFNLAIETHPDLIILDLLMPDVNGFEVIDRLKQHPTAKNIPVIICTGKDLTTEEKRILTGQIREVIHKGKSLREDLIYEVRKFEKLYPDKARMIDGLTGLYNERYFQNRLSDEINRLQRFKRPFSLLMANLDHFKLYNQMNGTHRGDKVITEVGDIFQKGLRAADPLCRLGGSTFSVILPETLRDDAQMIGDRLRYNIVKYHFPHEEAQPGGGLTMSVGVATFFEVTKSSEEAIAKVSRALQTAKREGGNRVAVVTGDEQ
jgi:diguanylate cyclase (GGDEF)-like protein